MPNSDLRARQALLALRLCLALLIFIHGAHRALSGGYLLFGEWLAGPGLPFSEALGSLRQPVGLSLAVGITALELIGAPLLAWGRWAVAPLCLLFSAVYATGIALVHAPFGWFVVGAGRNGAEYSVLLIVGLLATAWVQADRRRLR
ncbi:putative oxidoreductase [Inhella inkyongensis]|uniref:Putative oxidoreductase n=1 Tax=Inhella inkyongensis TaxID=392593 RepID=A0A840S8I7_9BURK|nr:DoxX family protein [Inhella inkyongensis]MBB5204729.1 putative oxidoreductase [Inhella inkyongensis]